MLCDKCRVFRGDPCRCCRTSSRISFLLQCGKLLPQDEAVILGSLRDTAGVLSDLVETYDRRSQLQGSLYPGLPPVPLRAEGAYPSVPEALGSGGDTSVPQALVEEENKVKKEPESDLSEEPKEDKKVKQKKKKDPGHKKEKKVKSPKESKAKKEKSNKDKEKEREAKEVEEIVEETLEEKGFKASSAKAWEEADKEEDPDEKLSKEVNNYVAENPEKFGLGVTGPKGGGKHYEKNLHPREPSKPPPGRHDGQSGREKRKERKRSRSRRRGTKGANHSQRGRDFGWWRQNRYW